MQGLELHWELLHGLYTGFTAFCGGLEDLFG